MKKPIIFHVTYITFILVKSTIDLQKSIYLTLWFSIDHITNPLNHFYSIVLRRRRGKPRKIYVYILVHFFFGSRGPQAGA